MAGVTRPEECERTQSVAVIDDFIESLKKILNFPKSERLPPDAFLPLYTETNLIEQMSAPNNQIIWGRRGTGKTHLLKAFTQKINADKNENSLSFYITCEDIRLETPRGEEFTDMERMRFYAREAFRNFIKILSNTITESYEEILKNKSDNTGTKNRPKDKKMNIDTALLNIMELCENGSERVVLVQEEVIRTSINATEQNTDTKIGFGITDVLKSLLSFVHKKNKSRKEEEERHKKFKVEHIFDFDKMKRLMRALVSALEIDRIYICVDELCRIDDKNTISYQPLFLDYLRQIFFSQEKISTKIASIREITTLISKVQARDAYGIEINHDVMELADLDSRYFNSGTKTDMFKKILYNRIRYFSQAKENYTEEYLINAVFKEERNLTTLIDLTHGIPRNFFTNLQKSLIAVNYDLSHYYLHSYLLYDVVKEFFIERRREIEFNGGSLYAEIKGYIKKRKEQFFIIKNDQYKRLKLEINNLLGKEVIHRLPSSVTGEKIRDTYKSFFVDSGYFLFELDEPISRGKWKDNFNLEVPKDLNEKYENYTLDVEKIETDLIDCPYCYKAINKKHPVYKKFKACYECGFDLTKTDRQRGSGALTEARRTQRGNASP